MPLIWRKDFRASLHSSHSSHAPSKGGQKGTMRINESERSCCIYTNTGTRSAASQSSHVDSEQGGRAQGSQLRGGLKQFCVDTNVAKLRNKTQISFLRLKKKKGLPGYFPPVTMCFR